MLPAKARHPRRPTVLAVRALAVAVLAALTLVAAGCGDEGGTQQDEPLSSGDSELTVTLDPDGSGGEKPMVEEVSCDEDETDPVCAAVARLTTADLGPVDPNTPCTEIFGGPDELEVEGSLGGEPVDALLTRANGCEIERFDHAIPLLEALFPDYEPGAALGDQPIAG